MNETVVDYWGKHGLFDCAGCREEAIANGEHIAAFSKKLVEVIQMKAFGEPILERFAMDDPSRGGYTLVQLIETSLIDGHFVEGKGEAYISVHSCKDFDEAVVRRTIHEFFDAATITQQIVLRRTN